MPSSWQLSWPIVSHELLVVRHRAIEQRQIQISPHRSWQTRETTDLAIDFGIDDWLVGWNFAGYLCGAAGARSQGTEDGQPVGDHGDVVSSRVQTRSQSDINALKCGEQEKARLTPTKAF